jgi:hypothetical protein
MTALMTVDGTQTQKVKVFSMQTNNSIDRGVLKYLNCDGDYGIGIIKGKQSDHQLRDSRFHKTQKLFLEMSDVSSVSEKLFVQKTYHLAVKQPEVPC